MKVVRVFGAVVLLVALTACVGGRRSGERGGDCPDVSGSWQITDHCESSAVGTTVSVSQSGCSFDSDWGGSAPGSGTVSGSGGVRMTVDIGEGEILTCTGSASSSTFTVDCAPGGCHVVLAKMGGGGTDTGGGGGRDAGGGGGSGAPGSACTCDSDCAAGSGSNPTICVGGICMSRAAGSCTEAGSPDGCPSGHRCWPAGDGTVQVCWPDCSSYPACAGTCDGDDSCVPGAESSCNPECGTLCGGGA